MVAEPTDEVSSEGVSVVSSFHLSSVLPLWLGAFVVKGFLKALTTKTPSHKGSTQSYQVSARLASARALALYSPLFEWRADGSVKFATVFAAPPSNTREKDTRIIESA
jgi:hypothetical protein